MSDSSRDTKVSKGDKFAKVKVKVKLKVPLSKSPSFGKKGK